LIPAVVPTEIKDIESYFADRFGPISSNAYCELVPSTPLITVRRTERSPKQPNTVLFTCGMSIHAMAETEIAPGAPYILYAELFLELPPTWDPHADITNPLNAWPIVVLREIAQSPHLENRNIGGPISVYCYDHPIIPNTLFSGFLVIQDHVLKLRSKDISLLRLVPLYPEEIDWFQEEGFVPLMQAFDRSAIPFCFDPARMNTALRR
jgi:hypothetical protein